MANFSSIFHDENILYLIIGIVLFSKPIIYIGYFTIGALYSLLSASLELTIKEFNYLMDNVNILKKSYKKTLQSNTYRRNFIKTFFFNFYKEKVNYFLAMIYDNRIRKVILKPNYIKEFNYKKIPLKYKINKKIIMAVLKERLASFEDVAYYQNDNKRIALFAIDNCYGAFSSLSKRLQSDLDCIKKSLVKYKDTLAYVGESILSNKEIALLAVKENGDNLKYFDTEIKNCYDICKCAVIQNGLAIEYVSNELKKNEELSLIAIKQNGLSIRCINDEFKQRIDFQKEAIFENGIAIQYILSFGEISDELKLAAVKSNGRALQFLSVKDKENYNLVLESINKDGGAFQYVGAKLRNNIELCYIAYQNNPEAILYFNDDLKNKLSFGHNKIETLKMLVAKHNKEKLENELTSKSIEKKKVIKV